MRSGRLSCCGELNVTNERDKSRKLLTVQCFKATLINTMDILDFIESHGC